MADSIDATFAKLAAKRSHEDPVVIFVVDPIKRALAIWASPYYRFDWPIGQFDNHAAADSPPQFGLQTPLAGFERDTHKFL